MKKYIFVLLALVVMLSTGCPIGLDYPLSKRTLIYTSYGRDSVPANNNSGFDVGIRHTF